MTHLLKDELLCSCQRLACDLSKTSGLKTRVLNLNRHFSGSAFICDKKDCTLAASCKACLSTLTHTSYTMGGRLIFPCPCGEIFIISPIVRGSLPVAAFLTGPIEYNQPTKSEKDIRSYKTHYATICAAAKSWHFSSLLSQIASSLCPESTMGVGGDYFFCLEKRLLEAINAKNVAEFSSAWHKLLLDTMHLAPNSFHASQAIAFTAFSLIINMCMDIDIDTKEVFGKNMESISSVVEAKYESDIEAAQKNVFEQFSAAAFGKASTRSLAIKDAISYIEHHFAEKITLSEVASKIYMSPHYLSKAFLIETGINFNEFLSRTRIEKAKMLLDGNSMPISEIASAIGFSDQSHFTKVFRRLTGTTPKRFQRGLNGLRE